MSSHTPTWKRCWRALALAAFVATPALADDAYTFDFGPDEPTPATVALSLSDDAAALETPGDFASTRLANALADESPAPCSNCGPAAACSCKQKKAVNKKVAGAYKGLYYNNNFDYLCDPCYDDWHLGDNLKRVGIGQWITVDIGGQYRNRWHSERKMRGLGLTGVDDDFLLYRTRLYTNVEFGDLVRVFAEGIDATSEFENNRPRPIEENRMDMLNLFVDVRLLDLDRGTLWARAGRQELLYGDQRVISPLDWANTRRTFEGYKVFWSGEAWDADFFFTRPMRLDRIHFDQANYDREFMGSYLTYKNLEHSKLDLYYTAHNNRNAANNFNYDTFGTRLRGGRDSWLWDFEAAYQSGNTNGVDHSAGAFTTGLGREFKCVRWKPTIWGYYDWASGDDVLNNGYDHGYPLAHKYLGFMDLFGRRNITDLNVLLTAKPHDRLKLLLWCHYFRLQNSNDVPYNVNMSSFNAGNRAGDKELGTEIDTMMTFTLTERAAITFGYSYFLSGAYYRTTAGVPYTGDASFLWTQFAVGF